MDARGIIVAFTWLAVTVIASSYLWIGGVNWGTDIAVTLLISIAFVVTFAVGFGLEYFQTQMDKEKPSTMALEQMSKELVQIKSAVTDLTKKVDEIQKELQE